MRMKFSNNLCSSINKVILNFQDFILEHYSEDGNEYEDVIKEFMNMRQVK